MYSRWQCGVHAVFEKATIDLGGPDGLTLYVHGKAAAKVDLGKNVRNPYFNEIAYFAKCVRTGKAPDLADPFSTRESIRIIFAEQRSALTGKKVLL